MAARGTRIALRIAIHLDTNVNYFKKFDPLRKEQGRVRALTRSIDAA